MIKTERLPMKLIRQKVYKEKSWQQRIFGHMCRSFHCKDIPQKGIIFTNTVGNKKTLFLQNFPSHGMLRNRMRNWKEMSRWELWSWWVGWWPQLSFSISAMRWWRSSCELLRSSWQLCIGGAQLSQPCIVMSPTAVYLHPPIRKTVLFNIVLDIW